MPLSSMTNSASRITMPFAPTLARPASARGNATGLLRAVCTRSPASHHDNLARVGWLDRSGQARARYSGRADRSAQDRAWQALLFEQFQRRIDHRPPRNPDSQRAARMDRRRPSPSVWQVGSRYARFEVCTAFIHVMTVYSLSRQKRPVASMASTISLPPSSLRLLPTGTTVGGRGLHPLKMHVFARRTVIYPHASLFMAPWTVTLLLDQGCQG